MNEAQLITKAKNLLTKEGGVAWSGTAWKDVFGIFDVIYLSPDNQTSYYQVSTKDHRWSRLTKIFQFRNRYGALPEHSYLMLWDYQLNDFNVEKLT